MVNKMPAPRPAIMHQAWVGGRAVPPTRSLCQGLCLWLCPTGTLTCEQWPLYQKVSGPGRPGEGARIVGNAAETSAPLTAGQHGSSGRDLSLG